MTFLKTIAVALYNFATSKAERQTDAIGTLTDESRSLLARTYFAKEAPLLNKITPDYKHALTVAEDFVIRHNRCTTFTQMCRTVARRSANSSYFQVAVLTDLIRPHLDRAEGSKEGDEATDLIIEIGSSIQEAAVERNPIKRRSILRKAIAAKIPSLDSNELNLAIELIIAISSEFRVQ